MTALNTIGAAVEATRPTSSKRGSRYLDPYKRSLALSLLLVALPVAPGQLRAAGGVVSAASPEAAAAGREILERGGNAIDAAVAVAFALGVTEPAMSGLGGGMQMLVYAPNRTPFVINGTSRSPRGVPAGATMADLVAHRATSVPSVVRTLAYAWERHGSGRITWAQLLAPAIRHAEEGFALGTFRHRVLERQAAKLRAHATGRMFMLHADGTVPAEGTIWKQPVLAQTLRRLAERGASDFYHGEIAREIAADMKANGGWITADDLARLPPPREQPAIHGRYRGWDVCTLLPPASGWVVMQILKVLELSDPAALAPGAKTRPELVIEALAVGHTSSRRNPIRDMANPEREIAERTSTETAGRLRAAARERNPGETTHYSLVDGNGMAVAVTASINNYFGALVGSPKLGFFYNDYLTDMIVGDPNHPFALRGDAPPYSSMGATILARDGRPHFAAGSPGSARIISTVAQVVQLWADGQRDISGALAEPRWHVIPPDRLYAEDMGAVPAWRERLEPRGWSIRGAPADMERLGLRGRNAYFGGVHAVAFENGRWTGAADPRRDGVVAVAK